MVTIQHTATIHGSYSAFNIQLSTPPARWRCAQLILDSTSALVSLVFGAIWFSYSFGKQVNYSLV